MSPKISIRLLAAQSDQRLVALVHEGHERAFEALVQRYRRPLLLYCRRSMRLSDAGAEDVLQHALLQAWLALARGTEVRDLRPWLYSIVHNSAVNTLRRRSESHGELADAMPAKAAVASESDFDRRIAVREALSDVAALPQMQRQAIFLTAVDGQSHEEVASALGITHGAVRGLLYRARATLRSAAAAITPQPLIDWASGGGGTSVPTAERLAELSAAGGALGTTGLLLKGAVIAVTAGALATGATVVHLHRHGARRPSGRAPSAAVARATGGSTLVGVSATTLPPRRRIVTGSPGAGLRVGSGPGHGHGHGTPKLAPAGQLAAGSSPQSGAGHDSPQGVAPSGRHGDARGGPGTSAGLADAGGGGSSSGSDGHGGRGFQGSDSSGGSPGVNDSGVRGSGSDGSSGGVPESSPGGPGQTVATEDRSGGESTSGSGS